MKENNPINKLEWNEIVKFLKNYGFIIERAKLYGGLKSAYDYGPLGTKIKDEIKQLWKEQFVDQEKLVHFIEGTILTQPKVLEASGYLQKFEDLKLTCPHCQRVEFFQKVYPEIDIKKLIQEIKNYFIYQNHFNMIVFLYNNIPKIINKLLNYKNGSGWKKYITIYLRVKGLEWLLLKQ